MLSKATLDTKIQLPKFLILYFHMKIPYTEQISWHKVITDNPMEGISNSNQKRLRSTVGSLPEEITHQIHPITPELLDWFIPLYESTIQTKNSPNVIDIREAIKKNSDTVDYFVLVLFENGKKVGATIFSEKKSFLSIAYRIYPNEWSSVKTAASPSLYSEYLICKHAHKRGYKKLSHGKDRNAYGMNASIGLAVFKLSYGCKAYVGTKSPEIKVLDIDEISKDVLIIRYDEAASFLKNGYLICARETEDKYTQVTKYQDQLKIETIYRD